jgi:hypothetical protein
VGHCGGKLTVTVATGPEGGKSYQLGYNHSSPTPAALSSLFASFEGIPLGFIAMGGLDERPNTNPPAPGIYVFIGSDMEGMFGHECPRCKQYWRSGGFPVSWRMVCPYCALRVPSHNFLTKGQGKYVKDFCKLVTDAMEGPDGPHVIDMDTVADAAGKDIEKPRFFYAEEAQQNSYRCESCGARQDILGRYGFCSSCGTRNELFEVRTALERIKQKVEVGSEFVAGLKDSVTEFDSAARALAKCLAKMVPMKAGRKDALNRMLFHNIKKRSREMKHWFDIDLYKGMSSDDIALLERMFARRHVYEHCGGEVDQQYIDETGDTTVRLKQSIREAREPVLETISLVGSMAANFHAQFHEIFPPDPMPISYHRPKRQGVG